MISEGPIDLGALDERVARARRAVVREVARFGDERGREEARLADPFDDLRDVAGQSTLRALRALEPGLAEAPHRDALDSRYSLMGLVPVSSIAGRAVKLW